MISAKLQAILDIDNNNNFLIYIVNRLQKDDYRGVYISQYNRYGLEFVIGVLSVIKNKLLELIQKYANPNNFDGDKTQKKDFHNWINETQQIFRLLKQTSYFQTDENNQNIALNIGSYGIFSVDNIKRSDQPKQEYFKLHQQQKVKDFELHHMVAISQARNKQEVDLLDNVYNLIYLHRDKHLEITRNKNPHVYLSINKAMVRFCDFDSTRIQANNGVEALYSTNNSILQKLEVHNKKAINAIYEFNQTIQC
jgi:hypothetical protein